MPWELIARPGPEVEIHESTGRVVWNDSVHEMLGFPERVDFLFDGSSIGLRLGGQYAVRVNDDGAYEIRAEAALQAIGFDNGGQVYKPEPAALDHSEGEVAGMVGAVAMPMP